MLSTYVRIGQKLYNSDMMLFSSERKLLIKGHALYILFQMKCLRINGLEEMGRKFGQQYQTA